MKLPDLKGYNDKYRKLREKKQIARRHYNMCLIRQAEANLEYEKARLAFYESCQNIERLRK